MYNSRLKIMIPENWAEKPPPRWGKIFWLQIYPFQEISSNFGFCGRKAPSPPPPQMREKFLTSDLSISGNFEQLWFLWRKSPPPQDEGKFFDTRSIHFRQFWATLVFVAEKPPPLPDEGKFFDFRSIHFRQFWATLVFVAEKPPPQMRENFDFRSIHFRKFWATLVFVAEKPPTPPQWGTIFWLQIYPFQAIVSNFGFCGRKAPPQWGKIFDFRSIHFRQFRATLVFVAEKPPLFSAFSSRTRLAAHR